VGTARPVPLRRATASPANAALASSTRFLKLDAAAWTANMVWVMARNMSPSATFDLGAATLSIAMAKRRIV
jgi:hypothetical protein